jgi:hypothetical protein
MLAVIPLETEPVRSESADGCDYKCTIARFRRPEVFHEAMLWKMSSKCQGNLCSKYQGNCFDGIKTEIVKGNSETKNTSTPFGTIQELDKVEGVERLRISSIEPNFSK